MAFRTRRRRPAVSWLPILGTTYGAAPSEVLNPSRFTLTLPIDGHSDTYLQAITYDFPPEQALASATFQSLSDFEGSAYRLRRIVGNLKLMFRQGGPLEQQDILMRSCYAAAGFMVLKVDEETGNPLAVNSQYGPLNEDNIRDPWIWRRTWLFGNNTNPSPGTAYTSTLMNAPSCNDYIGGNSQGSQIDQKTGRVIMPDERLFFMCQAFCPDDDTPTEAGQLYGFLDVRLVASMRRATNRRNASR